MNFTKLYPKSENGLNASGESGFKNVKIAQAEVVDVEKLRGASGRIFGKNGIESKEP